MRKSLFWTLDRHPTEKRTLAERYESTHHHAQLAEQLGFHCLWLGEHHSSPVGSIPNPAVLLASMANTTTTIRLGSAVAVLPLRDPTIIYEDYAMVDILSRGRLNLGVGCGSRPDEFHSMGIDYESRRSEFDRRLEKLRSMWKRPAAGDAKSVGFTSPRKGTPPLYVATTSADRAYQAGKDGFSVMTIVSPSAENLSTLQCVIEAHAKGQSESTVSTQETELVATVLAHAADDKDGALAMAATSTGNFLEAMSGDPPLDPLHLVETIVSRNTGFFGTTNMITQQLIDYHKLGVRHISFLVNFGGMPTRETANSIRLLDKAVAEASRLCH